MLHVPVRVKPSIAVGAIVKGSGGMTSTQHLNQMKLSAFVAAAAVIGASFIAPNPAEARNGWVKVGCGSQSGQCVYVKVIDRSSYPII